MHPEHLPPPSPSMNGTPNIAANHQSPPFAPSAQPMSPHYYRPRDDGMHVHQNNTSPMYGIQPAPLQIPSNGRRRSYGMVSAPSDIIPHKRSHLENEPFAYSQQPPPPPSSMQLNPRTGYEQQQQQHQQQQQPHQQQQQQQQVAAPNAVNTAPPATLTSVVIGEDVINLYRLYEEQNLLRRRVEINEERLQYLLHQNEQLRRQSQCSCIVNPVTLTTTSQSQPAPVIESMLYGKSHYIANTLFSFHFAASPKCCVNCTGSNAIDTNCEHR